MTKRTGIAAGAVLGTALLLGGAGGLVLAADPTASPAASPSEWSPWGMMGGQGMMGNTDMLAMHEAMEEAMDADGTCDPDEMQELHDQYHPAQ